MLLRAARHARSRSRVGEALGALIMVPLAVHKRVPYLGYESCPPQHTRPVGLISNESMQLCMSAVVSSELGLFVSST